jgi:hypothetical protein
MDLASPSTSYLLFWTITRAAALAVLATEGLFLLRRSRAAHAEGTPASRFVWAVTPAILLAGLSLFCLMAMPAPRAASQADFAASSPLHR